MVPQAILQRVFHIQYNNLQGTAFMIQVGANQYLVTAAHVIQGLQPNTSLSIATENDWNDTPIGNVWTSNLSDVALIYLSDHLAPEDPILVQNPFYVSQQIYFLGFPYGMQQFAGQINNGYPLPLVKTGILAGFSENQNGSQVLYCDGHNNPGFSGGPIITTRVWEEDGQLKSIPNIIGVISGYQEVHDPILLNGVDTGMTYATNTGLIVGYALYELLQRITDYPNG